MSNRTSISYLIAVLAFLVNILIILNDFVFVLVSYKLA